MTERHDGYVVGILGGMGPLASAAFVRTIYSLNRGQVEQSAPHIVLVSNPTISDRTATFLSGSGDARVLEQGIEQLLAAGASEVIVCCYTMHYLLPKVRSTLRSRVLSLIDTALEEIADTSGRMLLGCSTGSRRLGLFEGHALWGRISARVALPDDEEQQQLHDAIYQVKRNHSTQPLAEVLSRIAASHNVRKIIAGCTELHLLSPQHAGETEFNQRFEIIDPLVTLARRIAEERYATTLCA
jgi:aspartate racemase